MADNVKKRKIVKVMVDKSLCIGAASCLAIAPDIFELDKENIAVVKKDAPVNNETALLAAQSCPTKAISLYDEEGGQIYPEK